MKLSKNLSLSEVTKSNTAARLGIDNEPKGIYVDNLKVLAENVFQPIRDNFKKPIFVSSGFRSHSLNKAIGGAGYYESGRYIPKSQHCFGQAIDIDQDAVGKPSNADVFWYIYDNLDFDQLIWERGNDEKPAWVHVSYKSEGNRKQTLRYDGRIYTSFEDNR